MNIRVLLAAIVAHICIPTMSLSSTFFTNESLSDEALQCASSCGAGPATAAAVALTAAAAAGAGAQNATAASSTCLLVTLMDQFGDGWANGTGLRYWAEVDGDSSNVVAAAPRCGCPVLSGCVQPFSRAVEQHFHLSVGGSEHGNGDGSGAGAGVLPAHYWEMHWTVQVVEGGQLREKYYGGYNTSLSFKYSPAASNSSSSSSSSSSGAASFSVTALANAWRPAPNMTCTAAPAEPSSSLLASRVLVGEEGGAAHSYGNETGLYVDDGSGGYFEAIFVITDREVSDSDQWGAFLICG